MDRVAQLAEAAEIFLKFEEDWIYLGKGDPEAARNITRASLEDRADALGFPENEISSAIDTALGGR
ncbi:MAG TPA: hypothetical protein VGE09_08405 [Pseudoxanthomonas sp.]